MASSSDNRWPAASLVLALALSASLLACEALENGLARTPPMGWIAWVRFTNQVDCDNYPDSCISERLFMQMADRLAEDGYVQAGYRYINIDDCWSNLQRDASDELRANSSRFPAGLAALADYVHSKQLRLGIYGDCGTATCAGYPAQLKSEQQLEDNYFELDARSFAAWQLDSFKFDGCHLDASKAESICPRMAGALARSGRPILFSCEWPFYMLRNGLQPDWSLAAEACNLWRFYEDVEDSWQSVLNIIDVSVKLQATIVKHHGPGHWFDPDQLVIGNFGLSFDQARAQMALWCAWSAPLYMSNDLRAIAPEFRQLLTNQQLIAVNQDPLGLFALMVAEQRVEGTGALAQAFAKIVQPSLDSPGACPSFVLVYLSRATLGQGREVSFKLRDLLTRLPIGLAAQRQLEVLDSLPAGAKRISADHCKRLLKLAMSRPRSPPPPPGLLVSPAGEQQQVAGEQAREVPLEEKQVKFVLTDLFGDPGAPAELALDSSLTLKVNPSGVRAVKLAISHID